MERESIQKNCIGGGCGAKIGKDALSRILENVPTATNDDLLVGFDHADDAAVFRLSGDKGLVSTVDFFPPMVDDPYLFGQIAAANALSDVYAMGGTPFLALNLVCFPERFDKAILGDILRGGAEKVLEAGAVLGGGHSIYDSGVKYGLSVNGFVDTDRFLKNDTPRIGDCLILTKPLGTGIILAKAREESADTDAVDRCTKSMTRLNRYACEKLRGCDVSACTDVTGFGLLIHLSEMCGEERSAELSVDDIPVFPFAVEYADDGWITGGGKRNRAHFTEKYGGVDAFPAHIQEILFDPQTSGGLLIACAKEQADNLLSDIRANGDAAAAIIGRITERHTGGIIWCCSLQKTVSATATSS